MKTALASTAFIIAIFGALALSEIIADWFTATFNEVQIGLGIFALAMFGLVKFLNWATKGEN